MRSISNLLVLSALALSACQPVEREPPRGHKQPSVDKVVNILGCDFLFAGVCVVRPDPDYKISVSELGGGPHGQAFKVEFKSRRDPTYFSVIVNQVLSNARDEYPSCKSLGQFECKHV